MNTRTLKDFTVENLKSGIKRIIDGYSLNRSTMDGEDYSNIKDKDVYDLNMYSSNQQGNQTGSQYNGGNNASNTGGGNSLPNNPSPPNNPTPLNGAPPAMFNGQYDTPEMQFIPGQNQPFGRLLALALERDAGILNMNNGIGGSHDIIENKYKPDAIQFMHDYVRNLHGRGVSDLVVFRNDPAFRRELYNLR